MVDVKQAIEILNDILATDPKAIADLIETRVDCNEALYNHPTVQCAEGQKVGMLGIINGIFGVRSTGGGWIAAHYDDDDGKLTKFVVIEDAC